MPTSQRSDVPSSEGDSDAHGEDPSEPRADPEVARGFEHAVDEGNRRLRRSLSNVLATGAVGGMDVAIGVLALLVIEAETDSVLLGSLGFTSGFIALTLARSELFTENFYVPIAAVVAERGRGTGRLVTLWVGTLLANWVAGGALGVLIIAALPELGEKAVEVGRHFPDLGIGAEAFASAVLAGFLITLMTWMERGTDAIEGKLLAAIVVGFLLAAGKLHHTVVILIEMVAGLAHGASYSVADAVGVASFAALGNLVGGVGLVTVLRLAQVGRAKVAEEQERPSDAPDRDDE